MLIQWHFVDLDFWVEFNYLVKKVSTRKKKHQHKRQFSRLNETSNDFEIGKDSKTSALENETLVSQTNSCPKNIGRIIFGENSACHDLENIIGDRIRKAVDNAVMTVANRMHDAMLTAINNVQIPRVEMVVRSITESLGRWPSIVVRNSDQKNFTGNNGNNPLKSISSQIDMNVDQDRNIETRIVENFENGNFPALRPIFDRRAHAHHMVTGHNAPQNSIPDFLTGPIPNQKNPIPHQFTQAENTATYISPDNLLLMVVQTPQRENLQSGNPINRLVEATASIASQ